MENVIRIALAGSIKKLAITVMLILSTIVFTGCSGAPSPQNDKTEDNGVSQELFAMDTYMSIKVYGDNSEEALEDAVSLIKQLDSLLSTGDPKSEVSLLNSKGKQQVSDETVYIIERAEEIRQMTDGAFDVSVYPLVSAWGFPTQEYRVPSEEELNAALELIDGSKINIESNIVTFEKDGMKIDLGGIAKGYTSAKIMDIFREYGVSSGLVSLGGNVQSYGLNPDDREWKVAIQDPKEAGSYLGVLRTHDEAVITSGGYERYFEEDGKTYHHILDPATGYPADSGIISSTIVSKDGTLADGLSTALFIMGVEKSSDLWRLHSEEFDFILEDQDGRLYVTKGIADRFESGHEIEIIE